MSKLSRLVAPLLVAVLALAGCGGSTHHALNLATPLQAACAQAADGHGQPGACAPASVVGNAGSLPRPHLAASASPQFEDLSNNDPCVCGAAIRARGFSGLIVKANQGTGFIDWTAVPMVASARAAGLAVGVYDFDQDYTIAEAQVFVARARAAGILPSSSNTFPLYLDVEYGNFRYSGLIAQIGYIRSQGYRVGIYTGDWYWGPHAGCQWPAAVTAWLSGYPSAIVPCGLPGSLFQAHQYTSSPVDTSVFLGSSSQFSAFVTSAPPGPSPAQVRKWIAERGSSLHAYYRGFREGYGCERPVLTSGYCGQHAWRVDHFQKLIDTAHGYYPHCFGSRRNLGAAECQIVRPAVAEWTRAVGSTVRAEGRRGCESARGPVHNVFCDGKRGEESYFRHRIDRTLSTSRY